MINKPSSAEPLLWQQLLAERIHILSENTSTCLFMHYHTLVAEIMPDYSDLTSRVCLPIDFLAPASERKLLEFLAVTKGPDLAKCQEVLGRPLELRADDFYGVVPRLRQYAEKNRPEGYAFSLTPEETLLRDKILHMACAYPHISGYVSLKKYDAYLVDAHKRSCADIVKNYPFNAGGFYLPTYTLPEAKYPRNHIFLGGGDLAVEPERFFLEETIHAIVDMMWPSLTPIAWKELMQAKPETLHPFIHQAKKELGTVNKPVFL